MKKLLLFLRDNSGRGGAEALLVAGLGLLVIPATHDVGARLVAVFEKLTQALR